jgi:hypothetical protein
MEENKPFYKKYWWVIALAILVIIGNIIPKEKEIRNYDAECEQLYQSITNPKSIEGIKDDYQKAEALISEIKQIKDTAGLGLSFGHFNLETIIQFKDKNIANAEKDIKVKSQFSKYDGSNHIVEEAVKASMNNPDSYKHVNTKYKVDGNKIHIYTEFRGTNAFNAVVTSNAYGVTDLDGTLLEFKFAN